MSPQVPMPVAFRAPTAEEFQQMRAYLIANDYAGGEEEVDSFLPGASIVVFPDYVTCCPDYAGPVMVVLHEGSPGCVESYTWRDGEIEREQG